MHPPQPQQAEALSELPDEGSTWALASIRKKTKQASREIRIETEQPLIQCLQGSFCWWPHTCAHLLTGQAGYTAQAAPHRKSLQSKQTGAAARRTAQKEMTHPSLHSRPVAELGIQPRPAALVPLSVDCAASVLTESLENSGTMWGLPAQKTDEDADWRAESDKIFPVFLLWKASVIQRALRQNAFG